MSKFYFSFSLDFCSFLERKVSPSACLPAFGGKPPLFGVAEGDSLSVFKRPKVGTLKREPKTTSGKETEKVAKKNVPQKAKVPDVNVLLGFVRGLWWTLRLDWPSSATRG